MIREGVNRRRKRSQGRPKVRFLSRTMWEMRLSFSAQSELNGEPDLVHCSYHVRIGGP